MTKIIIHKLRNTNVTFLISVASIAILLIFSQTIAISIKQGIKIAVLSVIPSVFPFLILAEYLSSEIKPSNKITLIQRLFNLPSGCDGALICGLVCGFPCGIKYAVGLYEERQINKDELERLIGLVNNPSLAFVVSGVGMGMLNSLSDGLILYFSLIISILIISRATADKNPKRKKQVDIPKQSFSLSSSIKNAGLSSLTISSYIIFFSAVLGVIKEIIPAGIFFTLISSFLEIGNASVVITSLKTDVYLKFLILGFCLGFSGLSVHLQAFDILPKNISKRKYHSCKLLEGVLCGLVSIILKTLICIV